jgi:peptidoglycan/xylan/chitin deacetylase (PgdA/CDA1 family)
MLRVIENLGGFAFMQWKNNHKPLVLMYHRIIDEPNIGGLSPHIFEQQIAYICEHFRVVPIATLLDELKNNSLKPYTLAITFDDGHYDFYENAWPILQKYKVPASLYITTGFVSASHWLWPDLLKYILDNNQYHELQIEPFGTIKTYANLQQSWHKLGDYCLTLSAEKRNAFLRDLATAANVTTPNAPIKPYTAVTWQQLAQMQTEGLDVGSHTVSHPILSSLNDENLTYELERSAADIKQHLGTTPQGICYPNGRPEDINNNVIDFAQKAGYRYGLMGRKMPIHNERLFMIGRLAAHKSFDYFKWTLSRRQTDISDTYLQ